jgi:hypothetical protein
VAMMSPASAGTVSDSLRTVLEAFQSQTVPWQQKMCLSESIPNAFLSGWGSSGVERRRSRGMRSYGAYGRTCCVVYRAGIYLYREYVPE